MPKLKIDLGPPTFTDFSSTSTTLTPQSQITSRPPNVFDYSMLSSYFECKHKYYLRYEQHLQAIDSTPLALLLGKGIHASLAYYYTLIKDTEDEGGSRRSYDLDELRRRMKFVFVAELEDDIKAGIFPISPPPGAYDQKRCVNRAFDILDAYIDHYTYDDQIDSVLEVEQPFAVLVPYHFATYDGGSKSGEIVYVGRRDTVVMIASRPVILEHKTSSKISQLYKDSYNLSLQVSGYIKSFKEVTGENISNAYINVLGVYKTGTAYERIPITRFDPQLDLFTKQVIEVTTGIIEERERVEKGELPEVVFTQNTGACMKWNTRCQFWGLCNKFGQSAKRTLMESRYNKQVWSPYDLGSAVDVLDVD